MAQQPVLLALAGVFTELIQKIGVKGVQVSRHGKVSIWYPHAARTWGAGMGAGQGVGAAGSPRVGVSTYTLWHTPRWMAAPTLCP